MNYTTQTQYITTLDTPAIILFLTMACAFVLDLYLIYNMRIWSLCFAIAAGVAAGVWLLILKDRYNASYYMTFTILLVLMSLVTALVVGVRYCRTYANRRGSGDNQDRNQHFIEVSVMSLEDCDEQSDLHVNNNKIEHVGPQP